MALFVVRHQDAVAASLSVSRSIPVPPKIGGHPPGAGTSSTTLRCASCAGYSNRNGLI